MSLERTALRLAAVMALSNGFTAPYPTMAGNRVFDSRQDPIDGLEPGALIPLLTLYTDDDQGDSLSTNNGGPPFERRVQLVIEMSIGMLGQDAIAEGIAGIVLPETEPELDAMLDLFERQVEAVFLDGLSTWGKELSKVTRRIEKWNSMRFIEREGNIRLAARQIQITVALPLARYHDPVIAASGTTPVPTASIPAPLGPLLTLVAGSGSPYAGTAQALQTMMTATPGMTPIVLPALERVRFFEAAQVATNGAGTPRGPRQAGVAEADLS